MAAEAAGWDAAVSPDATGSRAGAVADDSALRQSAHRFAPGAQILVVDDNQDMREYLTRLLGAYWDVERASNGHEALELARHRRPDLIVSDVMMPGLDGFELLAAIRRSETLRATPVVLVTARAGEDTAIEGLLAGADDYIVKPFSARELIARVGGQLELSRVRRGALERNALRILLADTLRVLNDAQDIQQAAACMLVEHLGTERAEFLELDEQTNRLEPQAGCHAPNAPPRGGRVQLDDFEPLTRVLRAGNTVVYSDAVSEPGPRGFAAELAACNVRSQIAIPLLEAGDLRAVLHLSQSTARPWSTDEVSLAEEIAERTWTEVGRARAEAALRLSERRFRALVTASKDVLYRMSADWTEMINLQGMNFLPDTERPRRDWMTNYIPHDEQPRVLAAIREAICTKSTFQLEHRVIRADGTDGWTFSRAVPLLDNRGEITEWFGAATDITERRHAEARARPSGDPVRAGPH